MRQIIDLGIRRQPERARDRVVADAGQVAELESRLASPAGELGGTDELEIFVGAARQDSSDVLRSENRHGEGARVAVERRYDDVARRDAPVWREPRAMRRGRVRARASPCTSPDRIRRDAARREPRRRCCWYRTVMPDCRACNSATSKTARARSMPSTRAPARAIASDRIPPPHPTSTTRTGAAAGERGRPFDVLQTHGVQLVQRT